MYQIGGLTRAFDGSALDGCNVNLFLTATNQLLATTVSDSTGAYTFGVPDNTTTYYVTSYKVGSPDVTGMTRNDLVGA